MNRRFLLVVVTAIAVAALLITSCPKKSHDPVSGQPANIPANSSLSGQLIIFHAGSLSVPFAEVSKLYMEKNPGAKVLAEAAGSRDTARKVSDLGRECDILGSADVDTIYEILMPEYADWCIRFARGEIVIAYTEKSKYADEASADNWSGLLLRDGVRFGRSDPGRDPCGYRTLMVFQLAENHYGMPGLAQKLETKDGKRFVRPKETDLIALLETGEIDYLFIYLSVAVQHNLKFVKLPDEINLGNTSMADAYSRASVEVKGATPGETVTLTGAPIVYGVTIPKNVKNPRAAEAWISLLLSPEGAAILETCGQPPVTPAECAEFEILPELFKPLCEKAAMPE